MIFIKEILHCFLTSLTFFYFMASNALLFFFQKIAKLEVMILLKKMDFRNMNMSYIQELQALLL